MSTVASSSGIGSSSSDDSDGMSYSSAHPSWVARRFPSFFAFADGRRACRAA